MVGAGRAPGKYLVAHDRLLVRPGSLLVAVDDYAILEHLPPA